MEIEEMKMQLGKSGITGAKFCVCPGFLAYIREMFFFESSMRKIKKMENDKTRKTRDHR